MKQFYCIILILSVITACSKSDEPTVPEPDAPAHPEQPSDNENQWLIDYGEVAIGIDILDDNGISLVDPENPDNILDSDIHIIYKGIRYNMINSFTQQSSRLGGSRPTWYGVKAKMFPIAYSTESGYTYAPRIAVGEWSGEKIGEESFVFVWDNKSRTDTISFTVSPYIDDYYGTMLGYHYYLNGEEQPSEMITLHK